MTCPTLTPTPPPARDSRRLAASLQGSPPTRDGPGTWRLGEEPFPLGLQGLGVGVRGGGEGSEGRGRVWGSSSFNSSRAGGPDLDLPACPGDLKGPKYRERLPEGVHSARARVCEARGSRRPPHSLPWFYILPSFVLKIVGERNPLWPPKGRGPLRTGVRAELAAGLQTVSPAPPA